MTFFHSGGSGLKIIFNRSTTDFLCRHRISVFLVGVGVDEERFNLSSCIASLSRFIAVVKPIQLVIVPLS